MYLAPAHAPPIPSVRSSGPRPRKVLIIGAGPGGLAAALLLARAGLRVHVVERLPRVGGRCSAIEADGFRFDLGPTSSSTRACWNGSSSWSAATCIREVPMVRLDPQYRLVFGGGGELDCTPDVARLRSGDREAQPGRRAELRRFLADNRVKLEPFRPCLERPFLGWRTCSPGNC